MLVRASRPPNIAFVLPGLGAGGSEHIVSLLCNHFAALGWTVRLIVFEDETTPAYYSHHPAVRIVRLGMKSRRRPAPAAALTMFKRRQRLQAALEEAAPDLVISFLTRTNILSVLSARRIGVPVIVSERNNPELQTVGSVWSRLRQWTYPQSAGLVTMTQGAMDHFARTMAVPGWG